MPLQLNDEEIGRPGSENRKDRLQVCLGCELCLGSWKMPPLPEIASPTLLARNVEGYIASPLQLAQMRRSCLNFLGQRQWLLS